MQTHDTPTPRRLWTADRLDVRMRQGRIEVAHLNGLAAGLAALHAEPAGEALAAPAQLAKRVRALAADVRARASEIDAAGELERALVAAIERQAEAFAARAAEPGSRRLHGALRFERIHVDPAGRAQLGPAAPDRSGDPAEDLASLVVPLAARGLRDLAVRLLAVYAERSGDFALYRVIDVHAGLAALEAARAALEAAPAGDVAARAAAERLLEAPSRLAPIGPPRVLAVGGVMASGKSTLAERLSTQIGVPRIVADAVRDAQTAEAVAGGAHPLDALDEEATSAVYDALLRGAGDVLASGRSVVLDACFPTRALRARLRARAAELGVPLLFVECRADAGLVRRRLQARARAQGRDEAEWRALFDRFRAGWEPVRELPRSEHLPVDTSRDLEACFSRIEKALGARPPPPRQRPHQVRRSPARSQLLH